VLTIWAKTQHDRLSFLRLRKLAIVIQSHFRGFQARKYFAHVKKSARLIQAHWKGHEWRKRQGHFMKQMQQLRFRMQITASKVDNSQRLGHRLTNALAQLLSQKTVSGILHTCATIDMATEHSKQCCERLAEGGAILKLLQLIQTTNRSPPHEQVLKHALSILANLARFPDLALRIVNTSDSIMIIAEQLLVFRNKEEVFSKAMEVVQHVCSTPGCAEIIKRTSLVIRRLQNVAQMLERKHVVEKRNLEKIPQSQPILRKAAERKVREVGSHHFNIISTLQHFSLGAHCMPAVYGADKANFTQKDRRSSMIGAPSQLLVAHSQLRTPFQGHIAGNKSKVSIQAKVPRAALTDRSNY
jgi:abnormal spindle-like microcephaly-associated protein